MKFRYATLLLVLCGALVPRSFAATETVAVGECRPNLTSYPTIPDAVAAVPEGSTIIVCPGTYADPVSITDSLTLRGASPIATDPAVITAGISISGINEFPTPVIDIENIVVDGSEGGGAGVVYDSASGTLSGLLLRSAGVTFGCNNFLVDTLDVKNTYVYNGGLSAASGGGTGCFMNVNQSVIESNNGAGLSYGLVDGVVANNMIRVRGGTALTLDNYFSGMTVEQNLIEGASVGIEVGGNRSPYDIIRNNVLVGNAIGISLFDGDGGALITANSIIQSATQGIDLGCSVNTTVQGNSFEAAPVGIANAAPGDTISSNRFQNVKTHITKCTE